MYGVVDGVCARAHISLCRSSGGLGLQEPENIDNSLQWPPLVSRFGARGRSAEHSQRPSTRISPRDVFLEALVRLC